MRNGGVSFWYAQAPVGPARPSLPGDISADVCIVGAGMTGLWTAYYLARADPSLRIAVLERRFAGFGASGRNGGWLSGYLPGSRPKLAKAHGRSAVLDFQRAMWSTVDEVVDVIDTEGIEADVVRAGIVRVARNRAQELRLRADVETERSWGWTPDDLRLLDPEEVAARIHVDRATIGTWNPHCVRLQPARLVRGLAEAVERLGVTIYEDTAAQSIVSGSVGTDRGDVHAGIVLRCTEGYTVTLAGERRTLVPLASAMIATAPLPPETWEQIGWGGRELLGDTAHAYMYAQRTADDRIAFGGRGVPYRYASRYDDDGATESSTAAVLTNLARDFFPCLRDVPVEHAWSGVLGVPRDWCASVRFDPGTGLGSAGGYVGHGVAPTNLAGRTLRDLVLGRETELTQLPWVGRRWRRWEPEPLRWLGVSAVYSLYRAADRREFAGLPRTSVLGRAADVLAGR